MCNNISKDIDTTTLTGKGLLRILYSDNCTAHVEIPVGPFALIRAVIQKNLRQTLSGHQLNAEAIEKNANCT
jgi:hypothetical protein